MLYLVDIFIHLEQDLPVLKIKLRNEIQYKVFFRKLFIPKPTPGVPERLKNVQTQIYKTPKQKR